MISTEVYLIITQVELTRIIRHGFFGTVISAARHLQKKKKNLLTAERASGS